jgi:hypothetical protein
VIIRPCDCFITAASGPPDTPARCASLRRFVRWIGTQADISCEFGANVWRTEVRGCAVLRARQTPLRSAFWRVVRRPLQGSDSNADCRYAVAVSCEQSVSVGRPRPGRERRALTRIVSPPLLQAERRCTGLRLCCFCGGNRFSGTDERSPRSIGACPLARTASAGRHGSACKTACPVRRCYPCTPGSMASRRGAGRTQG